MTDATRAPARRAHAARLRLAGALVAILAGLALAGCDGGGDDVDKHFSKARQYHDQGELRAAVIELKNVLQIDPEHGEARWLLGQIYLALGDGAGAAKELARARDLGFRHAELDLALTRALILESRFDDALESMARVPASSFDVNWLVLRGQAQLGLRDAAEARKAFEAVLAGDADNSAALRGIARAELLTGNTEAAARRLEQAVDTDVGDVQTWLLKGELELSLRDFDVAERSFAKALELSPDNGSARMGLARALLARGQTDAAAAHVEALAAASPEHPAVNYLKALVARQRDDLDGAQAALREVLRVAPEHPPSLFLLGQVHYLKREFEQARDVLTRYLAKLPDNLAARKLLGATYIELRQPEQAVALLGPAAEKLPNDPQLLAMLGTAFMSQRDFETGRDLLSRAADLSPEASAIRTQLAVSQLAAGAPEAAISELEAVLEADPDFERADILLILTHFQNREFDKALAAARELARKQPDSARVQNLLGAAHEGAGDTAEARASYARALELDPDYATARLNIARLELREGESEQARRTYEQVLQQHRDHPVALVNLAKLAIDEGRVEESLSLLERAREHNPRAVQPRLVLGVYYLRRGNGAAALAVAREAYDIAPQLPAARLLLGRAQIANGMIDDAIGTLSQLAASYPDSPDVYLQLAMAYGQKRDVRNTRLALDRVLALRPGDPLATLGLGNLALRTGQTDEALDIARELQHGAPGSAAGFVLEGDVMMARRDAAQAASAYRRALTLARSSATVLKLYRAESDAGEPARAVETLESWLAEQPDDVAVRLTLASHQHREGATGAAVASYERVLAAQPANVLALNNLAWLYHEKGDARALALAERAYGGASDRAEIADTYGWLLVENGRVEQGLALLEKAASRSPENGDIRYHLAAALARAGETGRARSELRALLDSGRGFSEKSAAQSLYSELQ